MLSNFERDKIKLYESVRDQLDSIEAELVEIVKSHCREPEDLDELVRILPEDHSRMVARKIKEAMDS